MRVRLITAVLAFAALPLVVSACGGDDDGDGGGGGAAQESIQLGLVLPDLSIEAMLDIKEGAEARAKELGNVELRVAASSEPQEQVASFETLLAAGVDVIGVNALDSAAIVPAIEDANEDGVPVIAISGAPEGGEFESNLTVDHVGIGRSVGEWHVKALEGSGKVAFIDGDPAGVASRRLRQGWGEAIEEAPGMEIVTDSPPTGFDRAEALSVTADVLTAQRELDGIYGIIDSVALGAVTAVEEAGREDEILVAGANGECEALKSVLRGELDFTATLFLDQLGTEFVDQSLKLVNGEEIEREVLVPSYGIDTETAQAIVDGSEEPPAEVAEKMTARLQAAEDGCPR
jgi:ribose transport system substrate-binding protein